MSSAQHKATLRRSLRSALSHRELADRLLDSLLESQIALNAALDKLDADDPVDLDEDYSDLAVSVLDPDTAAKQVQHKATLRRSLQSALKHRAMANEIIDSVQEMQVAINAMLAKLDAEGGDLQDDDYAELLSVSVIDPSKPVLPARHKASMARTLEVALSHRRLSRVILKAISDVQSGLNAALAQIDTGDITDEMEALKVDVISPDSK